MSEIEYMTAKSYRDGMGQQIQRRISIWAYCKLNDIKYVHNPVGACKHHRLKKKTADNFFNLGEGELRRGDVDKSQVVAKHSMNNYFDKNGVDLYDNVRNEFREKYFNTEKPKLVFNESKKNVAVHVRRGDITKKKKFKRSKRFKKRGNDDEYFVSAMESVKDNSDEECKFYVYTQMRKKPRKSDLSMIDNFKSLNMDVELVVNGCPFSDIHHIMMSDVIIMSKSAFSYVPALFSDAHVIYNKFWNEPKSYWEIRR